MGKYLYIWEIDRTKIPIDPKERGIGFSVLMEMVKQDIKKGITKIGEHLLANLTDIQSLKEPR